MIEHVVLLVPGFPGFSQLGSDSYVEDRVADALAADPSNQESPPWRR